MFSSIGLDSMTSVDDTVTYLLFHDPKTNRNDILSLAFKPRHDLKHINGISILEVKPRTTMSNKILIFSHGNASDVYEMSAYMDSLTNSLGLTTVCYDYVGYGLSEGKPSEEGCNHALDVVVEYYKSSYDTKDIILIGQSLGTGVVTNYVSTHEWNTPVILISPYKSIPRVILDTSSEFSFRHNTFSTIYKLKNIKCPVKIFHGTSDEVISCHHSEDIFKALPNKFFPPTYYEGVGHNDILYKIKTQELLEVINYS